MYINPFNPIEKKTLILTKTYLIVLSSVRTTSEFLVSCSLSILLFLELATFSAIVGSAGVAWCRGTRIYIPIIGLN